MGMFFSDKTEQAVDLLHAQYQKKGFVRAHGLLMEAAEEGDADALYFLHRCLLGKRFIWQYAGFEEDEKKSKEVLNQSVQKGSALAVIGSMRAWGLTSGMRQTMPFRNPKQAWDMVLEKAEAGQPFCQYMVGNAYYWGDICEIENINKEEFRTRSGEFLQLAADWFERSVKNGYTSCAGNLLNMYGDGKGAFPPNPEKYREIISFCVEKGDPEQTFWHGVDCDNDGKLDDALHFYKLAVDRGHLSAYNNLGILYENGKGVVADKHYALQCYQSAAEAGEEDAYGNLGRVYFLDKSNSKDWEKTFYWLDKAVGAGNQYVYPYLGTCYLKGWGVQQDYVKARNYLTKSRNHMLKQEGLGIIYADGLGIAADIPKGVEYLQKAKADGSQEAAAHLAHFKKTLFGGWKRR